MTNGREDKGNTALHIAARKNQVQIAQMLLAKGASVRIPNARGRTPIHEAAALGNKSVMEVLLSHVKASPLDRDVDVMETTDAAGMTPLMLAAEENHFEVGRVLLKEGANVNATL